MRIEINGTVVALILLIMAVVPVIITVGLVRIDRLVNVSLYDYGLRFSYRWATPYWVFSGMIVGLSWFNIIAAAGLIFHILIRRKTWPERKHSEQHVHDVTNPLDIVDSQC